MAVRRTPFTGAAQGGSTNGNVAGAMSMPPMPGMTAAPAGNPTPNPMQPGGPPQGQPQPGAMPMPGMQPQAPTGGGPTSPFNIEDMLKTNEPKMSAGTGGQPSPMGMPGANPNGAPVRRTLQPWGDQGAQGDPNAQGEQYGDQPTAGGQPANLGAAGSVGDSGGGMAPMVMLRLLKSLGRI